MEIKTCKQSSASIDYNEIAGMCRKTAEPIFLTKNGEGDLVVMDIETYNRREKMLKLREEPLAVEEDRIAGRSGSKKESNNCHFEISNCQNGSYTF